MRCQVQHPLVVADDCQEGGTLFADAFFTPAAAQWFGGNGAMGGEGNGEFGGEVRGRRRLDSSVYLALG